MMEKSDTAKKREKEKREELDEIARELIKYLKDYGKYE